MADLPAKPSLDHLRRQARDLLRAARAGDTTAAGRIRAVADALTPTRPLFEPALKIPPENATTHRRSALAQSNAAADMTFRYD